jgi:hypothetical protein
MSKCEFVYEVDPLDMRLTGGLGGLATLRCTTHNCTWIIDADTCLIGRVEALEERIAKLERPTTALAIDELGNPFSLRRPATSEGD